MSYKIGIRDDGTIPSVHWHRRDCVVCREQVWIPGVPLVDDADAVCDDHEGATVIGSHSTYLRSILSRT